MDGTFDQYRPLRSVFRPGNQWSSMYSLDLSNATDRLPMKLQCILLSELFGTDIAASWAELLVGRPYQVPNHPSRPLHVQKVWYGAGQPMGALSS